MCLLSLSLLLELNELMDQYITAEADETKEIRTVS